MQIESQTYQNQWKQHPQANGRSAKRIKTKFRLFSSGIKLKLTFILSRTYIGQMLQGRGHLIHNNGATISIHPSHQMLVNRILNSQSSMIQSEIFLIDHNSETLLFTDKINYQKLSSLSSPDIKNWTKQFEDKIFKKKKCILTLLAVVGVQMDSQNSIMRKILYEKMKLKDAITELLKNNLNGKQEQLNIPINNEDDNGGVIEFGLNTDYRLEDGGIESNLSEQSKNNKMTEGGYFKIQNTKKTIRNIRTGKTIEKDLVVKTLKTKRKVQNNLEQNRKKIEKQLQIVRTISNKNYIINYYTPREKDSDYIFMDKYDQSLQQYITFIGDSLEMTSKIMIAKQIVEAIQTLHESNVVHRDIKPSNFLIDDSKQNSNTYKLKVIDFAESYCPKVCTDKEDFGSSPPYSPLECVEKRGFQNEQQSQMLAKKEIDYWSVGVTIYELFFRKLPVSFSRIFSVDIAASWRTELLLAVNQRQKYGFNLLEDIITIICIKMMKFQQNKRMKLSLTKKILLQLQIYSKRLIKIVQDSKKC